MDLIISSSISQSCLQQSSTSSDYALRKAENTKFTKDLRNSEPIQLSATQRLIPLVMNQCGRRGPHFDAMLREFASLLIKRSSGCSLLQGPFALPPTVTLAKVLSCWGSRLTWTAQREHAAQVIRAVESHKSATSFMSVVQRCGGTLWRRAGGQAGWQFGGRAG